MKARKDLYRVGIAAGLLACTVALGPVGAHSAGTGPERCLMDAEQIFQRARTKIVEVYADAINPYRVRDRLKLGLGAGFVIENGLVVTNYHVVADAQHVSIYDGKFYWDARVLGSDPLFDIALLEVPGYDFGGNALELAPPETVAIGQKAFAIGYPRGLGKSITQGIVVGTGPADAGNDQQPAAPVHPDGCSDQPRKLGRAALGRLWPRPWHDHDGRHTVRVREHRLCHSRGSA
jgi:S1-C subfamily serine protease